MKKNYHSVAIMTYSGLEQENAMLSCLPCSFCVNGIEDELCITANTGMFEQTAA
jgi:hypothetical protein